MPSEELLSVMAKFNEEMVKAGVMLVATGCSQVPRAHGSGSPATSAR
jgi:hypothetical protein